MALTPSGNKRTLTPMRVEFGEYQLDTQFRTLQREGQRIRAQSKAFNLLVYLIERRDQVYPSTTAQLCNRRKSVDLGYPGSRQGSYAVASISGREGGGHDQRDSNPLARKRKCRNRRISRAYATT